MTAIKEGMPRQKGSGAPRMKSEERRELILAAASGVFGERGYVGTTTDAVAKAAGVSQPYVVRMFGTKSALFEAVLQRSLGTLLREFRREIAAQGRATPELPGCIGRCYVELLSDRGLLLSLMQGFMLGADPEVGPIVRAGFLEVYRVLRDEGGFSPEQAADFLAEGMMINTLVALRMGADFDTDRDARELIEGTMPAKASMLRDLART
ncbi:MAG: TetR/AcrR family transcriptional regulator [Microbacteriaceae bacterium]|nr:TetR/AcrR family transcriptional regulator [Microbacteriaceae bacterium]